MEHEISFEHQSNRLAGSLHIADSGTSDVAIVMSQGSGPADRDNDVFFPPIRNFFLSYGISVLCYDKPGVGGSTGNWKVQSFQDRASELLAAVGFLQSTDKVNAQKIGLFGHSQGGWIVFLAASQSKNIDFVISNSGPAISPAEQDRFGLIHSNKLRGESEESIQLALKLHKLLVDAALLNKPYHEVSDLIDQHKNSAWDNYFSFDYDSWEFFKKNFNYDPVPILESTTCSNLVLLSGNDQLVPAEKCAQLFDKHLVRSSSQVHIFPEANHRMQVGESKQLLPEYFDVLQAWLDQTVKQV